MRKQFLRRVAALNEGDQHLGWKVGFGTPRALAALQIDRPLVGHLLESGRLESGSEIDIGSWTKPLLEPELAIRLAAPLTVGASAAEIRTSILGVSAAIELVDVEFIDHEPEFILESNVFQRRTIISPTYGDLGQRSDARASVTVNGANASEARDVEALTGDVVTILKHVVTTLSENGEQLFGGDIVLTGSIIPPITVVPGDTCVVSIKPYGVISVRFSQTT